MPVSPTVLERTTLGRQIADQVRHEILFGRIPAGSRLGQQELCEQFGTSRMPVRDALRQLTYEGFLETDEGRHSVVARLTPRDITDIYVVEGTLHGMATRRLTEEGSDADIGSVVHLHEDLLAATSDGVFEQLAHLNWKFHRQINRLAASPKLAAALRTLSIAIPRDYLVEIPSWIDRANAEHAEITTAMLDRDADTAELLMREHVISAGQGLVDYLIDRGVMPRSDQSDAGDSPE